MFPSASLKALLFDIGGPIVDESADYAFTIQTIKNVLKEVRQFEVSVGEIEKARDYAVVSRAPSFTKAVLWNFLQPDRELTNFAYKEVVRRVNEAREEVILIDGIREVLAILAEKYKLAIAANQPSLMRVKLEKTGLMKYFVSSRVSEDLGLYKPDTRFFLEICRRIGIEPANCCMIGDRLDNDIFPANILGMKTIWFKVGPHAVQQFRIPEDVPDETVTSAYEIIRILESWENMDL